VRPARKASWLQVAGCWSSACALIALREETLHGGACRPSPVPVPVLVPVPVPRPSPRAQSPVPKSQAPLLEERAHCWHRPCLALHGDYLSTAKRQAFPSARRASIAGRINRLPKARVSPKAAAATMTTTLHFPLWTCRPAGTLKASKGMGLEIALSLLPEQRRAHQPRVPMAHA